MLADPTMSSGHMATAIVYVSDVIISKRLVILTVSWSLFSWLAFLRAEDGKM